MNWLESAPLTRTPRRFPATPFEMARAPIEARVERDALRCLSVKDPWITLLGSGEKDFELRKQRTNYRGAVVLCSSVTPSRDARATRARELRAPWTTGPLGFALYLATLVDCRPSTPADAKRACTPPEAPEFVWYFQGARALPQAQPIKGLLGLYHPPAELRAYLKKAKVL